MYGRLMHDRAGMTTFQAYGINNQCNWSCSRRILNELLLTEAEQDPNIQVLFGRKCEDLKLGSLPFPPALAATAQSPKRERLNTVTISGGGQPQQVLECDVVIGADGLYSKVRQTIGRTVKLNLSQRYIDHSYKELTIPPNADGGFRLPPEVLHIWPRETFMCIALPNKDGSFTVTLFAPTVLFDELDDYPKVEAFFQSEFPDLLPHLPDLETEFSCNPVGVLCEIRCSPWNAGGRACLIGDAAHAMVPFHGQGLNCGLQDVVELMSIIDAGRRLATALPIFSRQHHPNASAIQDMALNNYLEMRHHVASSNFLLRASIERFLHQVLPKSLFIPRYSMVTFHPEIPYAEVVRRHKRDSLILDTLGGWCQTAVAGIALFAFTRSLGTSRPADAALLSLASLFIVRKALYEPISNWFEAFRSC